MSMTDLFEEESEGDSISTSVGLNGSSSPRPLIAQRHEAIFSVHKLSFEGGGIPFGANALALYHDHQQ